MSTTIIPKNEPGAERRHPHAEARYRIILLEDGAFAVEVSIPDGHPTRVSMFKTEADAEAWIAEHQRRVQVQIQSRRGFRPLGWN